VNICCPSRKKLKHLNLLR